jgi:hypothetical protein
MRYLIKFFPFGMAVTAVTGPEPPGKRNVRVGGLSGLWIEYSSTAPFRRPA